MSKKEPIFDAPWIIALLSVVMLGVHASLIYIWPQWHDGVMRDYAFAPKYLAAFPAYELFIRLVLFQYLHGNWTHVLVNTLGLLAFGTPIARKLGVVRFVVLFTLCGISGALAQAVYQQTGGAMVGASAGISGLFAGVLMLMQKAGHYAKGWRGLVPVSLVWMGINVVIGVVGMPGMGAFEIAWMAHIGGYISGLFLFGFLARRV